MPRTPQQLRDDLRAIWNAGLDGVRVDRLMEQAVSLDANTLRIDGVDYLLDEIDRLVVIGGGKASGAMAAALETILEPIFDLKEVTGWVNVPADGINSKDREFYSQYQRPAEAGCSNGAEAHAGPPPWARPLKKIHLHPARPMGVNEPTQAAVDGTLEMLRLAENLGPNDFCLCLLSGGGSALLPAPVPEISLQEKLEVTRFLSGAGATIQELNTVRKQISRIKGGGLKAICRDRRLVSLILSDVLGDPLDVIASGPTIESQSTTADALDVLARFASTPHAATTEAALNRITEFLRQKNLQSTMRQRVSGSTAASGSLRSHNFSLEVRNIIIGNNALAVDSAGQEALRRGYSYAMFSSPKSEGFAEEVGIHLAELALDMRKSGPDCLIHGGEPVVRLAPPEIRGLGGRNQQLVLAALLFLLESADFTDDSGIAILSGGTDGEDGPTDAAGAWIDPIFFEEFRKRKEANFNPTDYVRDYLQRNDAYRFFEPMAALLKTGPTETNVCDLRIVLVDRVADPKSME